MLELWRTRSETLAPPNQVDDVLFSELINPGDTMVKSGAPNLSDMRLLAFGGQANDIEYGVTAHQILGQGMLSRFTVGYRDGLERGVFVPTFSDDELHQTMGAVFFHTQPFDDHPNVVTGRRLSYQILPSREGDFRLHNEANPMFPGKKMYGSGLNIATIGGMTFFLGERTPYYDSHQLWERRAWRRLSGTIDRRKFTPEQRLFENKTLPNKDILYFVNSGNIDDKYFLFLSWQKLAELQPVYESLENICFGNGLSSLCEAVRVPPRAPNLARAITNRWPAAS